MEQPLLSILIPTTYDRADDVAKLKASINQQLDSICGGHEAVEIIEKCDDRTMILGDKRNLLYEMANGLYSWQIDSDDEIHEKAIELILNELNENPQVVSFEEYVNLNGVEYKSNFSNEYADWQGDGSKLLSDGFHFQRQIFYKCVILTELARSVKIPSLRFGEDHEWSKILKSHIRSEVHINKQLYRYIFKPTDPQKRYGLDK